MVDYEHNKPFYSLLLSELDEDSVQILAVEGEESISRLYEYRFVLVSNDHELDPKEILNKPATFSLTRESEPIKINGIISHFEQRGKFLDYLTYYAVLVPRMWRTKLTRINEVYQMMDIEQMVTQVLENSGFSSRDFEFRLTESYPALEYAVQYRETNFDYINRRLEHFGIFYFFEHRGDDDVIVFADSNTKFPAIDQTEGIPYNPNRDPLGAVETITELNYGEKLVTGTVRLKDYNYRFPTKQLMVESQIDPDAPGLYYEFGDHFKDENEAKFLANIRNEEIVCRSKILKGETDSRLFHAGLSFQLGKYHREDDQAPPFGGLWEKEFLITQATYRGNQRGLFGHMLSGGEVLPTYECKFEAIPLDVQYRPQRITEIPRVAGVMGSKIESGQSDEYSYLDEQGRYKVKMHFDLSDKTNGEASRFVRLAQPYSGTDYGMHFPNHEGAEMIWACIDGNIDRPLGLSTVPNPKQNSPVVVDNKAQNIIRTAGGNELIMDDTTEQAQISLSTPDAHKLLLDDKDDKIEITTTQKNWILMDDKNKNIKIQTTDGHFIIMDDKNTKITLQSKNGHRISINDTSGSENITVVDESGENTFVIDISNKKLVIKTENGDIDFHAPNGTIDLKATTFNAETTGDTTFKAANIEAEAQQDYKLKATNITEEASQDYKEKAGMNLSSEAGMDHKSKGMNVSSEAGANQEVKGSMVTVQSSGPNTIKGTPVMIN